MASLLSVENLQVQFQTKKGINTAVDGVSFSVEKGRILGIVGESGCGKSVTSMSILQLLGSNARISGGSIKLDGKELIGLPEKEMCRIRGNDIAMIFQDPMTALNPTLTILLNSPCTFPYIRFNSTSSISYPSCYTVPNTNYTFLYENSSH